MTLTPRARREAPGPRGLGALWAQSRLLAVALAVAIVLGLGLRLYGLDWDRGHSFTPHPDERAILMKVGELSLPSPGDLGTLMDPDRSPWNPRWFPYGSFPLYLLKGVQLSYSAVLGADLHDLRPAGRAISALADMATIVVVYLLGARVFGRRESVLAAALVALAVVHIQLSHFFAVDTIMAMCAIVALYFLYGVSREGRLRDSALAGVLIGLGMATKVSLAPIFIAFVMAHVMYVVRETPDGSGPGQHLRERVVVALWGLFAGVWASLLAFVVVEPYAVLDFGRFYADTTEQSEMVRRIRDYPYTRQYIDTTPYLYQVRQLATWGLGWPLGAVAWAGLLFVSLRGMRLRHGLAYLALGLGAPMALLLWSNGVVGIIAASGLAAAALLATLPFRSPGSRGAVLLLSWVVPYFLITGSFQVKFIRYLLPITPLLMLFGSRMLVEVWDRLGRRAPGTRPAMLAALVVLLASTGLYALSYMAVYGEDHTAVRTARWLNDNAPKGSLILREHWEEGIPDLQEYRVQDLPLYEVDREPKLQRLVEALAEADYIVFYSNRLYGTIPRLPDRYPITGAYYRLLFSGELGYQVANVETSYPGLAGLSIVEDTFGRPGVPEPELVRSAGRSRLSLDLGFADESFTVYDHPMGLVFENEERLSPEALRALIEGAAGEGAGVSRGPAQQLGLLMSADDAEAQRLGGTWTDIVRPEGWASRLPALSWLLLVEGVALLALPLTFVLFRPLADRGYLFAKALGLLAVALVVWLLSSLHWVTFSRLSIGLAVLLLATVSVPILISQRKAMLAFLRERWPAVLAGEAVFLISFLVFVLIRMANPDLWHPHLGGEKPMDLAYLTAVLKSSYMPPYDPWFAGGYINYYYWGQFVVATMIKATGIPPAVAFNLAVPLFFALTAAGAFCIVFNLAEGTRRALSNRSGGDGRGERAWSPLLAGLGGAVFVTVLGNLDGAVQMGRGLWRVWIRDLPFGAFDFWGSTRVMLPDPPGHEITEFPFFTFLFADLHAHLMSIPFTLLALGLSLAVLLGTVRRAGGRPRLPWGAEELARLAALGVAVGALRLINTWDYPTYLLVAVAAVFLAAYMRWGGLGMAMLVESGVKALLVFLVGYLAFLPFHASYEAFFDSVEATTNQTILWQFLLIHGLFIFIIGTFYVAQAWPSDLWSRLSGWAARPRALALGAGVVVVGFLVATTVTGWTGSTVPFLAALLALVLVGWRGRRGSLGADVPQRAFVAAIVAVSLVLAIGLDILRVEGDIDRMNSVFKLYMQVWVMLALAAAYLLWRLLHYRSSSPLGSITRRRAWVGVLAVLVLGASVYPVFGTHARLGTRFEALPLTLDGTAYARHRVYGDRLGDIRLDADFEGIRWLQQNVEGSPVVLEGLTPNYRWGGRVSVYTGLPTIIGWQWHQEQQRWGYRWAIAERAADVNEIYRTTSPAKALSLIDKYGVEYVYVGQLEGLYYPEEGLRKFFEDGLDGRLDEVYSNAYVSIYRVGPG